MLFMTRRRLIGALVLAQTLVFCNSYATMSSVENLNLSANLVDGCTLAVTSPPAALFDGVNPGTTVNTGLSGSISVDCTASITVRMCIGGGPFTTPAFGREMGDGAGGTGCD